MTFHDSPGQIHFNMTVNYVHLIRFVWRLHIWISLSLKEILPSQNKFKAKNNAKVGENNLEVHVVSVQPCFDKKLESSRKDFYHSSNAINEIDFVLSTTELWFMLEKLAGSSMSSENLSILKFLFPFPQRRIFKE